MTVTKSIIKNTPMPASARIAIAICSSISLASALGAQPASREQELVESHQTTDLANSQLPKPRKILPEGAFIAGQEGVLVQTPLGDKLFVYLPDGDLEPVALLLIPCLELERLEKAALESNLESTVFMVTGQIFAYHKRNYLLPSAWTQLRPKLPAKPGIDVAEKATKAPAADDEEISILIDELEQSRIDPQAALRRGDRLWLAPKQAAESDDSSSGGWSDGSIISRRSGRFVRQGVVWAITFDNDAESDPDKDVPLIVLPCLNHEKLENLAGRQSDEFTVQISGRVFVYQGRWYLLPSVFQAVPEGDVRPIG